MPVTRQVINLVDVVPTSRQIEYVDETTLKTSGYQTDYGYIVIRTDFERGPDEELIGVTFSVVP